MATQRFMTPPPSLVYSTLSFPATYVLLLTLNRPNALNCINAAGSLELSRLWAWLDNEPTIRVGIITGKGRAFCAGADLKEWQALQRGPGDPGAATQGGFGGLSRRSGKKPIVAAVNGLAYGGGCEMIVNCDIVIASSRASFAFPEIKRGVTAIAGALPRVVRTIGRQRAMEMALTGRTLSAEEARDWGLVNEVVNVRDEIEANEKTVQRAVKVAEVIAGNSPDAVIVSREGIKLGWEGIGAEDGARLLLEVWGKRLDEGENIKEGLRAFVEKRVPSWVPSKL